MSGLKAPTPMASVSGATCSGMTALRDVVSAISTSVLGRSCCSSSAGKGLATACG